MVIPSKHISKIDLSNQNLTKIPNEIFELKNLKRLNLSNNKIKTVPKEIEKLKSLVTLDLSFNRIDNFYSKICDLKNLKRLNLNSNKIKTVPKQIQRLTKLRVLSLANNKLVGLPEELDKLKCLTKLDLSGNILNNNFPFVLYNIESLEYVWFNRIPFKLFPMDYLNSKRLKAVYCYSKFIDFNKLDYNFQQLIQIKGNCLNKENEIHEINLQQSLLKSNINKTPISDANSERLTMEKIKKKKTTNIFISYSHHDKNWLEEVKMHLKGLTHEGFNFDAWDDERIQAGKEWKMEIDSALNKADIAILLISPAFLSSDFINSDELPVILNKAKENGITILSLILKTSRFKKIKSLSKFQTVNDPDRPLNSLTEPEKDIVLVKLTDDVESHINK